MLNQASILSLTATAGIVMTGTPRVVVEFKLTSRLTDIHLWLGLLPTPLITGSARIINTMLPNARVTDIPIILPGPVVPPGSSPRYLTY